MMLDVQKRIVGVVAEEALASLKELFPPKAGKPSNERLNFRKAAQMLVDQLWEQSGAGQKTKTKTNGKTNGKSVEVKTVTRHWSRKARAEAADRMRRYWMGRRKAKKTSAVAKSN